MKKSWIYKKLSIYEIEIEEKIKERQTFFGQ